MHCEVRDCCGDIPLDDLCGSCFQIQSSINDRDDRICELEAEVARYDCRRAGKYYETSGSHCPLDKPCFRCRAEEAEAKVAGLVKHVDNDCEIMLSLLDDTDSEDVKSMLRNLRDELQAALQEPAGEKV